MEIKRVTKSDAWIYATKVEYSTIYYRWVADPSSISLDYMKMLERDGFKCEIPRNLFGK